uniref:Uncharacterized protein n=1 Tax=Cucumis melo TaxID=3656 RepID=A0A9I9CF11_CUCME
MCWTCLLRRRMCRSVMGLNRWLMGAKSSPLSPLIAPLFIFKLPYLTNFILWLWWILMLLVPVSQHSESGFTGLLLTFQKGLMPIKEKRWCSTWVLSLQPAFTVMYLPFSNKTPISAEGSDPPPPAAISALDNSPHSMPSDFLLPPSTSIPRSNLHPRNADIYNISIFRTTLCMLIPYPQLFFYLANLGLPMLLFPP